MQGLYADATEPLSAVAYMHMTYGAGTPWLRQCERSRNNLANVSAAPTYGQLRAAVRQREGLRMAACAASAPHRDQLPSVGIGQSLFARGRGTTVRCLCCTPVPCLPCWRPRLAR
jgi:hypothetical protein